MPKMKSHSGTKKRFRKTRFSNCWQPSRWFFAHGTTHGPRPTDLSIASLMI